VAHLTSLALTLALTGGAQLAWAQAEPGAPRAYSPAPAAPDVVRLKNGGLLRGTISELVPGESVVLVTATGEVRRFAMRDVEYAGPAAGLPGAAPSAPAAPSTPAAPAAPGATVGGLSPAPRAVRSDGRAEVRVTTDAPELTLHQRVAADVTTGAAVGFGFGFGGGGAASGVSVTPYASRGATYTPLCMAPCTLAMSPGVYYLAVSQADGLPVGDNRPVTITPDTTTIRTEFESYAGVRTAGYLVGGATFLGGAALSVWAVTTGASECADSNTGCTVPEDKVGPAIAGAVIVLGGALASYIMGSIEDDVTVVVE
jgi:hypothetical protein